MNFKLPAKKRTLDKYIKNGFSAFMMSRDRKVERTKSTKPANLPFQQI